MSRSTLTWKNLAGLLAAPLLFACSDGSKTNPDASTQTQVDAAAAVDTVSKSDKAAIDSAADTAPKPDTPAVDAAATADDGGTPVDAPAVDAAKAVDAPQLSQDAAAGETTTDATAEEVALACAIIPPFKGGTVKTDFTLTRACSPYAIDTNIRVQNNATLTIEPGVTMTFKKDTRLTIADSGAGRLVAVGTAALPIVMTSAATTPAGGDWNGIELYGSALAGNQLSYVTMDYCGKPNSACIMGLSYLTPGALTVDHVTIDHVGVGGNGIAEDGTFLAFKITNTTFRAGAIGPTDFAIYMDAGSFEGIGAGNVWNGAAINIDGGIVKNTATWVNPGTPLVVTGNIRVEGPSSPTLTLSPGMLLRFAARVGLWVGYADTAQLVAVGTAAAPIVLTSMAVTPQPGDWTGITLWDGTAPGTKLGYLTLDYCGSGKGCIDTSNSMKPDSASIDHVIIDHVGAKAYGIVENGADSRVKITNCTFPAGAIGADQYAIYAEVPSFAAIGASNTLGGAMIELGGGILATSADWTNPGTPIAVTGDIRVESQSPVVLTIAAGTVFKFDAGNALWVAYGLGQPVGKLVVSGTPTEHVTFTSLASVPKKGDWNGIVAWNPGVIDITYADISYAGGYVAGGVAANSDKSAVTLTNSTVSNTKGYGVFIACTEASQSHPVVTITGCTFSNNDNTDQGPGPICAR
ncbi:MAG TPA: right-handed parallel beta-helix repeat-containing protein [Polyangia bacterium]